MFSSTSSGSCANYGSLPATRSDSFPTFIRKLDQTHQGPSALGDIVGGIFKSLQIANLTIAQAVSEYLELSGWYFLLAQPTYLTLSGSLRPIRELLLALRERIRVLSPEEISSVLFTEDGKLTLENAKQILGFKLLEAAEKNDEEGFSYLLKEGLVDPNALASSGGTILCHVAKMGRIKLVKELVAYGAKVNESSALRHGTAFPLLQAASAANGNEEVVSFLLSQGADIHATSGRQWPDLWDALMIASNAGNLPVVKLLLRNKANIHARDKSGNTALLLASLNGKSDVVRALIRAGSNLSATNYAGKNALTVAQNLGFHDTAQAIVDEPKKMGRERIVKIIFFTAVSFALVAFLYRRLPIPKISFF